MATSRFSSVEYYGVDTYPSTCSRVETSASVTPMSPSEIIHAGTKPLDRSDSLTPWWSWFVVALSASMKLAKLCGFALFEWLHPSHPRLPTGGHKASYVCFILRTSNHLELCFSRYGSHGWVTSCSHSSCHHTEPVTKSPYQP